MLAIHPPPLKYTTSGGLCTRFDAHGVQLETRVNSKSRRNRVKSFLKIRLEALRSFQPTIAV